MSQSVANPTVVVFDVGGVLIDWNPRHLYRQLFDDEDAMEVFLTHVCSTRWNLMQDAGRPFADGVAELSGRYPQHAGLISAYDERWQEMVRGEISETVAILETLAARGTALYGITNFSTEKFALTLERFGFFRHFNGIVVSGEVKLLKPDPAIYLRLLDDYRLSAQDCVFIDDSLINVEGARQVGMQAIHFQSPAQLREELSRYELL